MQDNLPSEIYKKVLLQTDQVVVIYNSKEHKFLFMNSSFETLWGKTIEMVKDNPLLLRDSIHRDDLDYVRSNFEELNGKEYFKKLTFRIFSPQKEIRWIKASLFKLNDHDHENLLIGFLEDFTSDRTNYDNVRKFAAKKNSILEIISHDLAGPLSIIKTLSIDLSEKLEGNADPAIEKIISLIDRSTERCITLIREFVKQEFLESSNVNLQKARVEIVSKMKELIEQYQDAGQNIKKHFVLKSSSDKIYCEIDNYKYSQVINNLISNAIKFTHDNGRIELFIDEKPYSILVTVKDNGIGIPKEHQDRLFEKFTPIRRKGLKGEPSVGLGMSICKTIIEWHNGTIRVESDEGEGCKIFIEVPKK